MVPAAQPLETLGIGRLHQILLNNQCSSAPRLASKGRPRTWGTKLSVDNMNTSPSGSEPLNGAAEPGPDLQEIDVFDVRKPVRAEKGRHGSRLETAGPAFIHFLKLFGPPPY